MPAVLECDFKIECPNIRAVLTDELEEQEEVFSAEIMINTYGSKLRNVEGHGFTFTDRCRFRFLYSRVRECSGLLPVINEHTQQAKKGSYKRHNSIGHIMNEKVDSRCLRKRSKIDLDGNGAVYCINELLLSLHSPAALTKLPDIIAQRRKT
ncbi:hypothetical protein M514_01451 [Trichuris suis]|uniref:Uncharacterized protein n=1 Tax=Trichuris suis TaxID=68888 RepID=A0A085MKN5_9BILA|nr:hypothetical protein M513_01451 [Trichuris suis]KFD65495.1 hypothetical protein M514_01451 [Trichuris suis]